MHKASETGIPAFRPLFVEFPANPRTWDQDDQFMFGSDLIVAPVLRPGERERGVFLPKGDWYDFFTGRAYSGDRFVGVPVTLGTLPVFVRAGAFIFQQPVVQHTGEMAGQPLHVSVYPAPTSSATLYEDDGATLKYRSGGFAKRTFTQTRSTTPQGRDQNGTIQIAGAEGSYRPAARSLVLSIRWTGEAGQVSAGGTALERVTAAELEKRPAGWTATDEGFIIVKVADRFDGLTITIQ